jgi:hypothetical protein
VVGRRWGDLMVDAVSPVLGHTRCGLRRTGGHPWRRRPCRRGHGSGLVRAQMGLCGTEFLAMAAGERGGGSGAMASGGGSTARRAWLPWLGLWRPSDVPAMWPSDVLAMWPAAGKTPTAMDPASTATRLCLVVAGGSSAPLPPSGSRFGVGRGN